MLLPHMVVKGKVGSIPVQFYCLSLHIKSIEIACGISDVWAGYMYWPVSALSVDPSARGRLVRKRADSSVKLLARLSDNLTGG